MYRIQRKQYRAYQRLRNFACVCPPQKSKLLVCLKADPKQVDLVPGFTRDVTGLGHHGTGDLEVQLRTLGDVERAQELFKIITLPVVSVPGTASSTGRVQGSTRRESH